MRPERHNLTSTPLAEFQPGQSLYVQRSQGGFSWVLLCEFVELQGRLVVAKVLSGDPTHSPHMPFPRDIKPGDVIKVLRRNCCLWGQREGDRLRWHWHTSEGWS